MTEERKISQHFNDPRLQQMSSIRFEGHLGANVVRKLQNPENVQNLIFNHKSPEYRQFNQFVIDSSAEKENSSPEGPIFEQSPIEFQFEDAKKVNEDKFSTTDNEKSCIHPDEHSEFRMLPINLISTDTRRNSSPTRIKAFPIEEAFLKKQPRSFRDIQTSTLLPLENENSFSKVKDFRDFQLLLKNLKTTISIQENTENANKDTDSSFIAASFETDKARFAVLLEKIAKFKNFLEMQKHKSYNSHCQTFQDQNDDPNRRCVISDNKASKTGQLEKYIARLGKVHERASFYMTRSYVVHSYKHRVDRGDLTAFSESLQQFESEYREIYEKVNSILKRKQ